MNQLMNFLQAASNTAASNVSGPVDLIAEALRAAGVPVPRNALLSSEWMREKGLTAPVHQGASQVAGDTLGLLAPVAAAAKAPQIARGLLQMGENASARSTMQGMGKQRGAIVWHGSPYKFDKFDSRKIGTGEGAQKYGDGLYLAEAPEVARSYAQSVQANGDELLKRASSLGLPDDVASNLVAALQSGKKFDPVVDGARSLVSDPLASSAQRQAAQRLLDNEMAAYNAWSEWSKPGSLYKVDLPDEMIGRMLDWDTPIRDQASVVKDIIRERFPKTGVNGRWINPFDSQRTGRAMLNELGLIADKRNPEGLRSAESALRAAGIPGIRYLDGDSRALGAGTRNYVVFPGEENALRILERNGVLLP